MKKWMIAGALLTMISVGAFAQQRGGGERPTPEQRATRTTEKMTEKLNLIDVQKKQILDINLEYAKKREAEMVARKAEMVAKKVDMKEQDTKIQNVLTLEQREQWIQLKEERKEHWKKERPKSQVEGIGNPKKGIKSGGN